jgi:hypothetical protein
MTRIDTLNLKLLDETISPAEIEELERLVELAGPGGNEHCLLLDIEALLRGQAQLPDLGPAVLRRLEAERAARTAGDVLEAIARLPAPQWKETAERSSGNARQRRPRAGWVPALVAAVVLLAVGLGIALQGRWGSRSRRGAADPGIEVVDVRGRLEIMTPGQSSRLAQVGQKVVPGQTLRTTGEDSFAVVEFADRTRLDLSPASIVRFVSGQGGGLGAGKRVLLSSGVLRAAVTPQPEGQSLVVQTPVAEVRVPGAASFLSVATPDCTWIDLADGRAEMVRTADGRQIDVGPGSSATVRADLEEMVARPWDRPRPVPRRRLDFRPAHTIAFSPDGTTLLAANSRRLYRYSLVSDAEENEPIPAPSHDGTRAALARDGGSLVLTMPDGMSVWDTSRMHQRLALPAGGIPSRPVTLAADGSWLAAQAGDTARSSGLFLWDVATGRTRASWLADGPVRNLASSSDGRVLIVGTRESPGAPTHRIHLCDAGTAAPLATVITDVPASWQVVLAPDGDRVATVGSNGVVQIWRASTRSIERVIDVRERPVRSLAFSPDGNLLAGGTLYGSVLLWEVETGLERAELKADQRGVRLLAFAPDGKTLATGTLEEPILLWDVPGPLPVAERAAASPD